LLRKSIYWCWGWDEWSGCCGRESSGLGETEGENRQRAGY